MQNEASATDSPKTKGLRLENEASPSILGDFTTTWSVIPLSLIAIAIGVLSAFVALGLLRLIGLFTDLFFYQRWSSAFTSLPAITWAQSLS